MLQVVTENKETSEEQNTSKNFPSTSNLESSNNKNKSPNNKVVSEQINKENKTVISSNKQKTSNDVFKVPQNPTSDSVWFIYDFLWFITYFYKCFHVSQKYFDNS